MEELLDFLTSKGIITVQDAEQLTALELIYLLIEKVNECVITVNELTESGPYQAVIDQLTIWKDNGILSDLISQAILDDIKGKLESRVVYLQDYKKLQSDDSDSERLQRAIEQAQSLGKVVKLENKTYQCLKPLQLDISKTSLDGNGATLDFSAMDTKLFSGCLKVIATDNPPYHQNHKAFIKDLELNGNRRGLNGVILGHNQDGVGVAHLDLDKLNIQNCKDGIVTGKHTYLIRMNSVDIFNCEICLHIKHEDDSGENIALTGCTLYNSSLAVKNENPNSSVHLTNTSLDYNIKTLEIIRGNLHLTGCHLEGNLVFDIQNDLTTIVGSHLIFLNPNLTVMPFQIGGTLQLENSFISGGTFGGVHQMVKSGNGNLIMRNNQGYDITDLFAQFYKDNHELLDMIAYGIEDEGSPRVSQWNVKNCVITQDTSVKESGNFSYKIVKQYGNGSNSAFHLIIPFNTNRQSVRLRMKAKALVTSTLRISYAKMNDVKINVVQAPVKRTQEIGAVPTTIGTDWGWINLVSSSMTKPEWADCLYLEFNLFDCYEPTIYLDRINVNEY